MVKYNNGKIYSIRSYSNPDLIYIGSTTQTLGQRMSKHKNHYKQYLKGNFVFVSSYEIMKFDDCYIELVEVFSCENKMELDRREGQIMRQTNCVNKYVAGRTRKEFRNENKEKLSEKKKEYYNENKEKISERRKEKYHCLCGGYIRRDIKIRHYRSKKHHDKLLSVFGLG